MTTPHRASPEQWAQIKQFVEDCGYDSCLLELCDRIAALEADVNSKPTPNPSQIRSSLAPAGGLVESVSAAICPIDGRGGAPINWEPEARAAIQAVAEWLEHRKPAALHCAALLREEVERV
jgi:hypothetical protein